MHRISHLLVQLRIKGDKVLMSLVPMKVCVMSLAVTIWEVCRSYVEGQAFRVVNALELVFGPTLPKGPLSTSSTLWKSLLPEYSFFFTRMDHFRSSWISSSSYDRKSQSMSVKWSKDL